MNTKGKILIIDDDKSLLKSSMMILRAEGYDVETEQESKNAVERITAGGYDLTITDIRMPNITGLEIIAEMRRRGMEEPVILMTAYADLPAAIDAIRRGAFDFLLKPFNPDDFILSVERGMRFSNLLKIEKSYKRQLEQDVLAKTKELRDAFGKITELSNEMMFRLIKASEYKDQETGTHILRVKQYSVVLAEELDLPRGFVDKIAFVSPLHDVGKIGVSESILLKTERLTNEEFNLIKHHTHMGSDILKGSNNEQIQLAAAVALSHHERWDGSGYPLGLKGEEILLEARIVNICDQYDALMTSRPYKPSFGHEKTYDILTNGDGRTMPNHFDPKVLDAFKNCAGLFKSIYDNS
ncbi:response regulator [Candidatus Magnetominusculus xianensis]|uniref:Two-component system response regulator n=1 Tax=Candidatus Magnetominusculus xianensis TaxID=1748249 RepID=A0ABR5SJ97_9BACT|nr:response regulator [Candidatus Magnetominusculus xianensis]KWT91960.1 two-component system response regulator [Candidatus Magnetominusculus xianensis]MBF0403233.1 response regulator [Nitrospirota bacterium]